MVYIDVIYRLSDGTIVAFGTSLSHPARPESSKFIRGDIKCGGFAFHPVPNEPSFEAIFYDFYFHVFL